MSETQLPRLRCGVLGTTASARMFYERIRFEPQFELIGCDAEFIQGSRPSAEVRSEPLSAAQLLAHSDIEWLFVAVEGQQRMECIQQALLAGRNVVVTAPVATSTDETARLIEVAQARGRRIELWLPHRGDSEFQRAQQVAHGDEIGDLRRVRFELRQLSPWMLPDAAASLDVVQRRTGEERRQGVLKTFGWAAVDQLLDLVAAPVERVFACTSSRSLMFGQTQGRSFDDGVDSSLLAYLEFANGCEAQLDIDLATTSTTGPNWWLQGARGGYERGRVSQTMSDGEVFDVPLNMASIDAQKRYVDVLRNTEPQQISARYAHWVAVTSIVSTLQKSAETKRVTVVSSVPDRKP